MPTAQDIISISVDYRHMTLMSHYSYELKEMNGETMFSCRYFITDADYAAEVTIEQAVVDSKYMKEFRELTEKHGFLNMKYKKPGIMQRGLKDAPIYGLALSWPKEIDGRTYSDSLHLNYHPPGTEALKEIFLELAEACADKAVIVEMQN